MKGFIVTSLILLLSTNSAIAAQKNITNRYFSVNVPDGKRIESRDPLVLSLDDTSFNKIKIDSRKKYENEDNQWELFVTKISVTAKNIKVSEETIAGEAWKYFEGTLQRDDKDFTYGIYYKNAADRVHTIDYSCISDKCDSIKDGLNTVKASYKFTTTVQQGR